MRWIKQAAMFVWGYFFGFGTLLVLFLVFGDYGESVQVSPIAESVTPIARATLPSGSASGVTFEQICNISEGNMTDPQLESHAARFAGQSFSGWHGWVYDVAKRSDETYNLEIAMEERGLFWARDIVVENIPIDLAFRLNVEQPIIFDGRINRVEYMFDVMCNPIWVDDFVLH